MKTRTMSRRSFQEQQTEKPEGMILMTPLLVQTNKNPIGYWISKKMWVYFKEYINIKLHCKEL